MSTNNPNAVAEGSSSVLAVIKETTLGVTPDTPHFTRVRHTAALFNPGIQTVANDEITGYAQGAGTKLVALDSAGGVTHNVVIGAHPLFQQSAMRAGATASGTISVTAEADFASSDNSITLTGTSTGGFSVLKVGATIKVSGAADAGNNGFLTVASVESADKITVFQDLTDATDDDAEIEYSIQTTGSTLISMAAEHAYTNLSSDLVKLINGMVVKTWTFSAPLRGLVTGKFDTINISQAESAASLEDQSDYGAATAAANDILNSTSNLQFMALRPRNDDGTYGAAISQTFSNIDFSLDNASKYTDAIAEGLYPIGITQGDVDITITLKAYYRSKDMFEQAIASGKLGLFFAMTDGTVADGNCKFFAMPVMDIENYQYDETKKGEDGMATLTLKSRRDTLTGESLIISEHLAS